MALKGDLFAQSQLMPLDAFRITHLPEQGRDFGLEDDAVVLDAERGVIGHVLPVGLRSASRSTFSFASTEIDNEKKPMNS